MPAPKCARELCEPSQVVPNIRYIMGRRGRVKDELSKITRGMSLMKFRERFVFLTAEYAREMRDDVSWDF